MIAEIISLVVGFGGALIAVGSVTGIALKSKKARQRRLAHKHVTAENQKLQLEAIKKLAKLLNFDNVPEVKALDTYKEPTEQELNKLVLALKAGTVKLSDKKVAKVSKYKY